MALLLLAGGGAGAYFFMGSQSEAATGDAVVAEAPKGPPIDVSYVPLDPIILPIIDRNGISQIVSMVVSIQVTGKDRVEEVKASMPKLADAYLSDMYGTLSHSSAMEGGVIKVSMLKSRLTEITDRVLGAGVAEGVLLQVLQQHRS